MKEDGIDGVIFRKLLMSSFNYWIHDDWGYNITNNTFKSLTRPSENNVNA